MRAKVIFTDGFFVSPTVETVSTELLDRLKVVVFDAATPGVASTCTAFVLECAVSGFDVTIHNTPEGRSQGVTYQMLLNQSFWPGQEANQAGVFLVNVNEKSVDFWGGKGFEGTPEFTPTIPQKMELSLGRARESEDRDGGPQDPGTPPS